MVSHSAPDFYELISLLIGVNNQYRGYEFKQFEEEYEALIKWAIQRGTSVIPKSSNPNRLKENFEAQNIELSTEEMEKINTLDRGQVVIGQKTYCCK